MPPARAFFDPGIVVLAAFALIVAATIAWSIDAVRRLAEAGGSRRSWSRPERPEPPHGRGARPDVVAA